MEICEFFTKMTGFTPTNDQKNLLNDLINKDEKYILISAARQTGKTLSCSIAVMWMAFEFNEPVKILLVAQGTESDPPIYMKIKEIFRKNRDYFINKVIAVNKYDDLPHFGFETKAGSYVNCQNATEGQVRGYTADFVFIDEAGIIRDDVILSAFDCKSGDWSKFICLSTPPEKPNLFTEWCMNAKKLGFKVYNWTEIGLLWHSEKDLKFKKSQYSSQRYKREVLGKFLSQEERAFFSKEKLKQNFIDCTEEREGRNEKASVEIGIDWGFGSPNPTVITVTEKLSTKRKMLLQEVQKNVDFDKIAAICNQYESPTVKTDSEPNEFNIRFAQVYKKTIHKVQAKVHKDLMMAQLQARVLMTQLKISDIRVDLYKEMSRYRKGKRAGDNRVDSLALACYEPVVPFDNKPPFKFYVIPLRGW